MENVHRRNRNFGWLALRGNTNGNDVSAEVAGLVGSKDLKFHLVNAFRKGCLSFKEARLASITQIKFL
jgi:hypothetical protein